ncbi:hypothetical protein [Brevundimonas sp. Root1279]|uniref:hypothetical protein n=1 Tax=Brevundimonas sp. Root1279 TaxID=1736443 RepID=UPI0006F8F139|nr:hypothetical protein [Brevundimonas sp. Root1279]KQW84005.1 hypothetical protein ASC65_05120 [Brevundimonas sp. Root1279]
MISSVLAAFLALILPQEAAAERLPRPSDEALLAAVQAEVPGARIVSSEFHDTPRGGARDGCGLFEVNGQIEPFHIMTAWQDAKPERIPPIRIEVRGEDGVMRPASTVPLPAEPAHWKSYIHAPVLVDAGADGIDRRDRNRMISDRWMALSSCRSLVAPEGTTWVTELEPHPDPARQRRAEEQAKALTDMLFGPR